MKTDTTLNLNYMSYERIANHNGIEIWVDYNAEKVSDGESENEEYIVELNSVEFVIENKGVNILSLLSKKQQELIKQLVIWKKQKLKK